MAKKKIKQSIKVGDIVQIPTAFTFRVCKVPADTPEESEWTPVDSLSEAEILSFVYQHKLTAVSKPGRPKKVVDEEDEEEEEIDDEEL